MLPPWGEIGLAITVVSLESDWLCHCPFVTCFTEVACLVHISLTFGILA